MISTVKSGKAAPSINRRRSWAPFANGIQDHLTSRAIRNIGRCQPDQKQAAIRIDGNGPP